MIIVSFSGGATSAYMSKMLLDQHNRDDLKFVFMNTGVEHPRTLEFINECDQAWGLNVVWLEAEVHHGKRVACTHKIVSYDTATRDESIFVEMVKKYGLPNVSYLHCTRELKINPYKSYVKGLELDSYKTAIGIRYDEIDRIPEDYREKGYIYPLADNKITKNDVEEFWDKQSFKLGIDHQLGNCMMCYKKSPKRLEENLNRIDYLYDWVKNIEANCGKGNRKMFRKNMNVDELISYVQAKRGDDDLNISGACSDQCEMF